MKRGKICFAALFVAVVLAGGWGYMKTASAPGSAIEMIERNPGTLQITNLAAPGTQIPADLYFKIQVVLGDELLPTGTSYTVNGDQCIVETAGALFLRTGETAVIEVGDMPGTDYCVTELSAAFDGYCPTYEGIAAPVGNVVCTDDGAAGVFSLGGTVHITITNAD